MRKRHLYVDKNEERRRWIGVKIASLRVCVGSQESWWSKSETRKGVQCPSSDAEWEERISSEIKIPEDG